MFCSRQWWPFLYTFAEPFRLYQPICFSSSSFIHRVEISFNNLWIKKENIFLIIWVIHDTFMKSYSIDADHRTQDVLQLEAMTFPILWPILCRLHPFLQYSCFSSAFPSALFLKRIHHLWIWVGGLDTSVWDEVWSTLGS